MGKIFQVLCVLVLIKYYFIKMKMAVLRQPDLEALLAVSAFDEQQKQKHFLIQQQLFCVEAITHKRHQIYKVRVHLNPARVSR